MTKRKALKQIAPPDPAQIMMTGVAPVSMGERLGWLANQPPPLNFNRPVCHFYTYLLKCMALTVLRVNYSLLE